MSANDRSGFAEKILRVLDGTADRDDFLALDRRIAEDPKAAQYYIDMLLIHMALSRSTGFQAGHSGTSISGSGLDKLFSEIATPNPSVPVPAPTAECLADRGKDDASWLSGEEELSLRAECSPAEQERVDQIRRYAQEQLDRFLQQHQDDRMPTEADAGSWDLFGAGRRAVRRLGALTKAGVRTAKVLATWSLAAGLVVIVAWYFYSHRVVATVVDSVHAQWTGGLTRPTSRPAGRGWKRGSPESNSRRAPRFSSRRRASSSCVPPTAWR